MRRNFIEFDTVSKKNKQKYGLALNAWIKDEKGNIIGHGFVNRHGNLDMDSVHMNKRKSRR